METDRDTCQQRHEAVGTGKLRHPQKNGRLRRSLSNLHVSAGRKTTLKVAGPGGWPRRWGGRKGKKGPFWWIPDGRRRRVCVCLPYFFSFKAFFLFVGSQRGRSGGGSTESELGGGVMVIIFWYLCWSLIKGEEHRRPRPSHTPPSLDQANAAGFAPLPTPKK